MPLFKFSSSDMLNTTLVEPTGHPVYTILTRPHFVHARHTPESSIFDSKSLKSDSSHMSTQAIATRRTVLSSFATGKELASIGWIGLQPTDIVIGEEKLCVKELFGCMGALTSPKVFGVSTRFDTEYYWLVSSESLTLLDYDANEVKGQLHHSSLLVGSLMLPLPPPLPGNNYLRFEPHPLASDDELIVTFILMEILRRSRFAKTHASSSLDIESINTSKSWLVWRAGERLSRVGKTLGLGRRHF